MQLQKIHGWNDDPFLVSTAFFLIFCLVEFPGGKSVILPPNLVNLDTSCWFLKPFGRMFSPNFERDEANLNYSHKCRKDLQIDTRRRRLVVS